MSPQFRDYDNESGKNRVKSTPRKKTTTYNKKGNKTKLLEYGSPDEEEETNPLIKEIVQRKTRDSTRQNLRPTTDPAESDDDRPAVVQKTTMTGTSAQQDEKKKEGSTHAAMDGFLALAIDRAAPTKLALTTKSVYYPFFYQYYTYLHAMETTSCTNENLYHFFPEYHSLCERIYYAYIAVYQILRARNAAQALTRDERKAFTALEKGLAPESAVIAGPMASILQSLGMHQPADNAYPAVIPGIPKFDATPGTSISSQDRMGVPNIPVMIALLHAYLALDPEQDELFETEDLGHLLPFDTTKDTKFLGQVVQNGKTGAEARLWFQSPGLLLPLLADKKDWSAYNNKVIRRYGIPKFTESTDTSTILKYLGLDQDQDLSWLRNLGRHAEASARFFKGATTLANISPVTGPSITALGQPSAPKKAVFKTDQFKIWDMNFQDRIDIAIKHIGRTNVNEIELARASLHQFNVAYSTQASGKYAYPLPTLSIYQTQTGPVFRHNGDDDTYSDDTATFRTDFARERHASGKKYGDIIYTYTQQHMYDPTGKTNAITD